MSNEKFTPGPWWASFEGTSDIFVEPGIYYKEVRNEAERSQAAANAYLISAAPEMYAELADLLDAMERGLFPQVAPGVDYPAVMEKKHELRKLLAKARGEND